MSIAETIRTNLSSSWLRAGTNRAQSKVKSFPEVRHYKPGEKVLFDAEQTEKLLSKIEKLGAAQQRSSKD